MPLQATSGAASYDTFGSAAAPAANYIEDVFSTYLYTGNGSTQTFNNGVDLSTKGGMVWVKQRSSPAEDWRCVDSARGITNGLQQNLTNAQQDWTGLGYVTAFNTNGFSIGSNVSINTSAYTYASWTFRKQPKFFDVVTYTGTGNSLSVSHALGSTPGCIIIKRLNSTSDWFVYHQSVNWDGSYLKLNSTAGNNSGSVPPYFLTNVQADYFLMQGTGVANVNGATYVAYLFAHDAGGFGLTGSDNVISCGSFSTDGSGNATVNLGYEPQWILAKRTNAADSWLMVDNMRGFVSGPAVNTSDDARLFPNLSNAEVTNDFGRPTATGFEFNVGVLNSTYIYIAIRRGPMKTPTTGTSVFKPMYGTGGTPSFTTTFPVDLFIDGQPASNWQSYTGSRLQGGNLMYTNSTAAETSAFAANIKFDYSYGWGTSAFNSSHFSYSFGRAPGFFDVVCYTGTGVARTVTHNLGVVPEMMIVKRRSTADNWFVYSQTLGNLKHIALDGSSGASGNNNDYWNSTSPTSTVFTVGIDSAVNFNGSTYVAYLFASCPGVSKVGSYTGTGTTLQVNCGFSGGARFVLIKRTDSTGDWYVWDSARGIVSGNDPYLLLNSTAAEVTNTDYVDTYSAGFEISSTAPAAINANGGTFIFLAVS